MHTQSPPDRERQRLQQSLTTAEQNAQRLSHLNEGGYWTRRASELRDQIQRLGGV